MCAQYGSIFNGPSLFTLLPHPTRLSQPLPPPWVPSFTVAPATPCFPWRENNESEAQLITFLTCFRTLYAKPDWEKYLHIQRWKMRQGIRTHQERKKKRQWNKTKLPFLPSGQSPNSWPWHLKPSETWPSPTSSASHLFSLMPCHPCFTWMAQHKVPDEALLLPSTCWGCPSPATHSSRRGHLLQEALRLLWPPESPCAFFCHCANHTVLPLSLPPLLACEFLEGRTRYDPLCVPRAQPKARHTWGLLACLL